MTGPEHYRAAEEEFVWCASFMEEADFSAADRSLARAQVHATLALAAATVGPTGAGWQGDAAGWFETIAGNPR